jgi:UDP-N-acetylmuramate dehydrogenase
MMPATNPPMLRGELRTDEPLKRYNTWRVGGPARRVYLPADIDDLAVFLAGLDRDEPLLWIGLGSNLLVRDGGYRGTVICLQGRVDAILIGGESVSVDAGASCAKVARECARAGLVGAAFLAGIPGTMGGALAMNAGAFGGETWPIVAAVDTIDRDGVVRHRAPGDFDIGYREVHRPGGEWFVRCELKLQRGDGSAEQAAIRDLLARRAATQPTGLPSCGSTFRNPPGDHAARLIEAAGLKGYRIGGAEVSPKHANFLINTGDASAADIEALVGHVHDTVCARFGVALRTEFHAVGDPV